MTQQIFNINGKIDWKWILHNILNFNVEIFWTDVIYP